MVPEEAPALIISGVEVVPSVVEAEVDLVASVEVASAEVVLEEAGRFINLLVLTPERLLIYLD